MIDEADRAIVSWASEHATPWYYTHEVGLPDPCLEVHFGQVTAFFSQGRLVRVWAHADHAFLDDMFQQLARVFELCGRAPHAVFEDLDLSAFSYPGNDPPRSASRHVEEV